MFKLTVLRELVDSDNSFGPAITWIIFEDLLIVFVDGFDPRICCFFVADVTNMDSVGINGCGILGGGSNKPLDLVTG